MRHVVALICLLASFADASHCPGHLVAIARNADADRLRRYEAELGPVQSLFPRLGPYLEYFTSPDGEEILFGAICSTRGRVVTLRQIVILPRGAATIHESVNWTVGYARRASTQLFEKARRAGFAAIVMEGERVTGAQRRNSGRIRNVRRVFYLDR